MSESLASQHLTLLYDLLLACRTENGNFVSRRLETLLSKLKSRDSEHEDLCDAINYLHRRGYVYQSRNSYVEPTPKAVFVLQAAQMWPLRPLSSGYKK